MLTMKERTSIYQRGNLFFFFLELVWPGATICLPLLHGAKMLYRLDELRELGKETESLQQNNINRYAEQSKH